eukprot:11624290-Alexandrium_andersonii.AAC.1
MTLGALWDPDVWLWYVERGTNRGRLAKWPVENEPQRQIPTPQAPRGAAKKGAVDPRAKHSEPPQSKPMQGRPSMSPDGRCFVPDSVTAQRYGAAMPWLGRSEPLQSEPQHSKPPRSKPQVPEPPQSKPCLLYTSPSPRD